MKLNGYLSATVVIYSIDIYWFVIYWSEGLLCIDGVKLFYQTRPFLKMRGLSRLRFAKVG